jgi:hypothetical protein
MLADKSIDTGFPCASRRLPSALALPELDFSNSDKAHIVA